jgi:RHS repeat-associated protein
MPLFSSNIVPSPLPNLVPNNSPAPDLIGEQARALKYSIDLIYEWVYCSVDFLGTWGDHKGALGCYIDCIGNSFDQTSLLMQLLSQSGKSYTSSAFPGQTFTPGGGSPTLQVSYVFGDSTLTPTPAGIQLNAAQMSAWLSVANDSNAATNAKSVLSAGGIPCSANKTANTITVSHVWLQLTLTVSGTNHVYVLDPSCKIQDVSGTGYAVNAGLGIAGLESAMSSTSLPYSVSQLITDADASVVAGPPTYLQSLNRAAVREDLTNYSRNLVNYIQKNMPGARMDDIIGGRTLTPITSTPYQSSLPYQTGTPSTSWGTVIPNPLYTNLVQLSFENGTGGFIETYPSSQLYASRLTLTSDASIPTNWTITMVNNLTGVSTSIGSGSEVQGISSVDVTYKFLNVSFSGSPFVQEIAQPESTSGSLPYVIIFFGAGPVSRNMVSLQQRIYAQNKSLDPSGITDEKVWGSMLNMISLSKISEDCYLLDMIGRLTNVQPIPIAFMGCLSWSNVPGTQDGDFIFDIWGEWSQASALDLDSTGAETGGFGLASNVLNLTESLALQQTVGATAFSAPISLDTAIATLGTASPNYVYLAASSTDWANNVWPAVQPNYQPTFGFDFKTIVAEYFGKGSGPNASLMIPSAPNPWSSPTYGHQSTGWTVTTPYIPMDPRYSGGFFLGIIETAFGGGESEPANQPSPSAQPKKNQKKSQDPIDLQTGDYLYSFDDFSTGSQPFPYGLTFTRYYDSSKRLVDGPLGLGWRHNFSDSLNSQGNVFQSLGLDTASSGAITVVLLLASIQLGQTQDYSLGTQALTVVARAWWQDQCTNNTVVYSSGTEDLVFTRLAYLDSDTTYEYVPPPRYALTLVQTISGPSFTLTDPQQTVKNFNGDGQWTTWQLPPVSAPQVTVTLSYNTDGTLHSVANAMGRTLTFNYTTFGANKYLSNVLDGSDSNNRYVTYTYTGTDPYLELQTFTDPLSNEINYTYVTLPTPILGLMTEYALPANPSIPYVQNTFDSLNRVMQQADPNSNVYTYYFAGSRTEEVDPQSNSRVFYFDPYGSIITEIDKLGYITTRTFDGLARLVTETYPELNFTTWNYPITTTGVIGVPGYNNVMSKVYTSKPPSPTTLTESWQYDSYWNKVSQYIDFNGNVTTYSYDDPSMGNTGNLLEIQRPIPVTGSPTPTITLAYNSRGQLTTYTDETSLITKFNYDSGTEELLSIVRDYGTGTHLNLTTTFGYDSGTPNVGNIISVQNPNGNTTTFGYDAKRRLISKTDPTPFSYVTNFTYDANDNRLTVQRQTNSTPAFQVFTWTYYPEGRIHSFTDPLSYQTVLVFDTLRRLQTYTDAESRVWQFAWDPLDRISQITDPSTAVSESRTYTPNGWLLTLTQYPDIPANAATTTYSYDSFDRPFQTTYPDGKFEENVLLDNNGNVKTYQNRSTNQITRVFDALNRVIRKTLPSGQGDYIYSYDLHDRLIGFGTYPTVSYTISYDSAKRFVGDGNTTAILDANGNITKLTFPNGSGANYVTKAYDQLDRLVSITTSGASSHNATIAYDALSRRSLLTFSTSEYAAYAYQLNNDVTNINHVLPGGASASVNMIYGYNKTHQVTSINVNNSAFFWQPSGAGTITYPAANNLNQYTGTGYGNDTRGNLTTLGTNTFAYDAENRLIGANSAAISYDALNRMSIDASGNQWSWFGDNLVSIGTAPLNFVGGDKLDDLIFQVNAGASTTVNVHADRLGSPIQSGGYGPFGENGQAGVAGFTGQQYYGGGAVYSFRNRFYNPAIGRFMQPDPIGYPGGNNLYLYVMNDPVTLADPLGLDPMTFLFGYTVPLTNAGGEHTSILQFDPLGTGDYDQIQGWSSGPYGPLLLGPYGGKTLAKDILRQLANNKSTPITPRGRCVTTDSSLRQAFDKATEAYKQGLQLPYFPTPLWPFTWNSNGWTSGLQEYGGLTPVLPPSGWTPGYDNPVPFRLYSK